YAFRVYKDLDRVGDESGFLERLCLSIIDKAHLADMANKQLGFTPNNPVMSHWRCCNIEANDIDIDEDERQFIVLRHTYSKTLNSGIRRKIALEEINDKPVVIFEQTSRKKRDSLNTDSMQDLLRKLGGKEVHVSKRYDYKLPKMYGSVVFVSDGTIEDTVFDAYIEKHKLDLNGKTQTTMAKGKQG
ncbi:MAG: hypothetical protein ACRDD8_03960, partial [Bacteroidales bacterium]